MKLIAATRQDCPTIFAYIQKLAQHEESEAALTATPQSLERALFDEKAAEAFLVAYQDATVGIVIISKNFSTYLGKPTLFLEDLFLDEAVRGLGLGKAILVELQQIAKQRAYGRVEWTCLNENIGAKQFYESQGARPLTDKTIYRFTIE
ncbi:MAG: GNAT family N-acetyltransferase [Culicoidibacterales bacterium]